MLKKNLLVVFILLEIFIIKNGISQPIYNPVESKGKIPSIITSDPIVNLKKDINSINRNTVRIDRKAQKRFYYQDNFFIDRLLKSGNIVFGHEMAEYVQEVGNYVLKANNIKQDIHFFIYKSPELNAFAVNKNMIFINIGLLAKIENEAQLAYIISHELIHYIKKHTLNRFIEGFKYEMDFDEKYKIALPEKISTFITYSQQQELIADELGFIDFYSKTDYSTEEAVKVFDILQTANIDSNSFIFDYDFISSDNSFNIKSLKIKRNTRNYKYSNSDTISLHPDTKIRKNTINELAERQLNNNEKKYIISEEKFKNFKRLALLECSHLYLNNGNFLKSLHNSYLYQNTYGENNDLIFLKSYALYASLYFNSYFEIEFEYTNNEDSIPTNSFTILSEIMITDFYNLYQKNNIEYAKLFANRLINCEFSLSDNKSFYELLNESEKLNHIINDSSFFIDKSKQISQTDSITDKPILNDNKTLIFINPIYHKVLGDEYNGKWSYRKKKKLKNSIKYNSHINNINHIVMDIMDLKSNEAENYNNILRINNWIYEYYDYKETNYKDLVFYSDFFVKDAISKLNADKIVITGIISRTYVGYKNVDNFGFLSLILAYPAFPIAIIKIIAPESYTLFAFACLDINTKTEEKSEIIAIKGIDNDGYINSQMYKFLKDLKDEN